MEPSEINEKSQTNTNSWWQNRIKKIKTFSPLIDSIVGFATVIIATYAIFQYCSFKDFTEKNNRAHLSISEPRYESHEIVIRTPTENKRDFVKRVKFSVKNSGNTPALNVRDSTFFKYLLCKPEIVKGVNEPRVYFYAPGDNIEIKTLNDDYELTSGAHAYFYGRIEYSDIFGQKHWLTFCYQYIKTHNYFIIIGKDNQTGTY